MWGWKRLKRNIPIKNRRYANNIRWIKIEIYEIKWRKWKFINFTIRFNWSKRNNWRINRINGRRVKYKNLIKLRVIWGWKKLKRNMPTKNGRNANILRWIKSEIYGIKWRKWKFINFSIRFNWS